jgi:hypothetical protein
VVAGELARGGSCPTLACEPQSHRNNDGSFLRSPICSPRRLRRCWGQPGSSRPRRGPARAPWAYGGESCDGAAEPRPRVGHLPHMGRREGKKKKKNFDGSATTLHGGLPLAAQSVESRKPRICVLQTAAAFGTNPQSSLAPHIETLRQRDRLAPRTIPIERETILRPAASGSLRSPKSLSPPAMLLHLRLAMAGSSAVRASTETTPPGPRPIGEGKPSISGFAGRMPGSLLGFQCPMPQLRRRLDWPTASPQACRALQARPLGCW